MAIGMGDEVEVRAQLKLRSSHSLPLVLGPLSAPATFVVGLFCREIPAKSSVAFCTVLI